MYPSRFKYEAPSTVVEAIALLSAGGGEAKVLAGGQSLLPMMKLRFANPEMIIDINNLEGLDYHTRDAHGKIRIGALCRHSTIEHSDFIAAHQPTMAAASHLIADPIVRNRGTLVGSLCHADPQGDWSAVMTALDGHIMAQGPAGKRTIRIKEFVTGPFQTALAYDEIAIEAVIPAPKGTVHGGYLKLERRVGDFATAGAAVALETEGDKVIKAGIALTGVGSSTIDAVDAADYLMGKELSPQIIEYSAHLAAGAANPSSDHRGSTAYKRNVIDTFVSRILTRIATTNTEKAA